MFAPPAARLAILLFSHFGGRLRPQDGAPHVGSNLRTSMEQNVPKDAKTPEDAAEWPSGAIRLKDVKDLCPTGTHIRVDVKRHVYQISYNGSTYERAWRRRGHAESLRQVVMWAWEQHTVSTGARFRAEARALALRARTFSTSSSTAT